MEPEDRSLAATLSPLVEPAALVAPMTVVYLFGAAREDATAGQLAELRRVLDAFREGAGYEEAVRGVFAVMGEGWSPADRWLVAMEALRG